MAIDLQWRDREIMKFIYTFRVAAFSQIQKRYFANVFRSACPRRLRQLESARLLDISVIGTKSRTFRYVNLNEKAWREIRESWAFEIDRPMFKSESPLHDLRLAELFFRFERLSTFGQLLTENLLQSSSAVADDPKFRALSKLQADAALVLNPKDSESYVYGVELETSKKAPDRYREKLLNYYMADGIDGVLYVCDSQVTLDAIARIDKEIHTEGRRKFFPS